LRVRSKSGSPRRCLRRRRVRRRASGARFRGRGSRDPRRESGRPLDGKGGPGAVPASLPGAAVRRNSRRSEGLWEDRHAARARPVGIAKMPEGEMALDVGPKTLEQFERLLDPAKTIFWNGPMGVFEHPPFDRGTKALAMLLAESEAVTIVGGGESVAAVNE